MRTLLARLSHVVTVPLYLLIGYLVLRIATYGLFWGDGPHDGAWGGPTLTGAWIVHGLIALPIVAVAALLSVLLRAGRRRLVSPAQPSNRMRRAARPVPNTPSANVLESPASSAPSASNSVHHSTNACPSAVTGATRIVET